MAPRTKPKPPARPGRALLEWSASAPSGAPLTVDRERRVIEGVRVLGRFSRNRHGLAKAENGTEYTPACMRAALPLYEDVDVLADHDTLGGKTAGLQQRRTHRGVEYVIGALRNVRLEGTGDRECVRADLHYFDTHPITPRLLEDVERALGRFGLSHDASAGSERFDAASKRLVIESLATVRSVDLVRKPATNRNLWESETVGTNLREMLDERRPKLSKNRRKWADRLLEDDAMAPSMDAPVDAPATGTDPDDALWTGFMAAIQAIAESYKAGDLSAKDAGKKVTDYLKAHDSLTGDSEPGAPSDDTSGSDSSAGSDADKTEAEKELAATKHKLAVRELCEELKVSPDRTLLESLEALPIDQGRKLVERERARGTGGSPRGAGAHGGGGGKQPAKKPKGAAFLDAISE